MHSRNALFVALGLALTGCASADIPQAYKGQMFGRTGPLSFYSGRTGFYGPVLGPGTHFTGTYDELRSVDCSTMTRREPLTALTKDGVQFGLNIYVRFSADCSDDGVKALLTELPPDASGSIPVMRVYETFVQPAVGEAVREVVSPYRANDINEKREQILLEIRKRFLEIVARREKNAARVYEVNLSNLDFPDQMDDANTDRAVQAILKDKAIAERERVTAEIETMTMRRQLSQREGEAEAAKIDAIGAALHRNPDYLQFDLQAKMPEIYRVAGAAGNLVITAPNPSIVATAHDPPRTGVSAPAPRSAQVPPPPPPSSAPSP